jgi:hypothetical protein
MSEENKIVGAKKTRRAIVTTAAQVAVTAPAVGLLLSASTKPAAARVYSTGTTFPVDADAGLNSEDDLDTANNRQFFGNVSGDDVFIPDSDQTDAKS